MSMPTLSLEVGFAVGASTSTYLTLNDTARGKLGIGTLAPDVVWTDVTAYLRNFHTARGVSRVDGPVLHYDAGTARFELDDTDGRFDPANLAGPYVSGGVTQVKPTVAVRLRATWAGVTYDVWRGFAESWVDTYPAPTQTVCILSCVDAAKQLADVNRAAVGSVGSGEDTGTRIGRILDSAGWSSVDRVLATGDSTLQATTLTGSAWQEAVLANDSEIGELYVDGSGRVVFRNRNAVLTDSRSNTSQATFGDAGGSELPYVSTDLDYSDQQLINDARITRAGGAEQNATSATSQTSYLRHTFQRSDIILQTDPDALNYAGWIVSQCAEPELRFANLVVNGRDSDSTFESAKFVQILTREIGDRITVIRRPPRGGTAITRDVLVRGVTHDGTPATWQTVWQLQSATRLQFFVLDHATLGQLGLNSLGF